MVLKYNDNNYSLLPTLKYLPEILPRNQTQINNQGGTLATIYRDKLPASICRLQDIIKCLEFDEMKFMLCRMPVLFWQFDIYA